MKNLGEFEQKLPQNLRQRSTATLVLVVAVLAGVFGVGGAKLKGYETKVEQSFSTGMYSISADLDARLDAAANLVSMANRVSGADAQSIEAVNKAIATVNAAETPAQKAEADRALAVLVDALYDQAKPLADSATADLLAGQLAEFNSRGTIINNNDYNFDAEIFNDDATAFPANLIGLVWGVDPLEYYE